MSRFADKVKKNSRDNRPSMLALLAAGVRRVEGSGLSAHTLRTQAHARGVTPSRPKRSRKKPG